MNQTAILISGHLRTFARCLPTQAWHVFRRYPNPAFFVSTVKDADSHTAELLRTLYPKARVEVQVLDCQPELPIPVKPTAEDWTMGRMYGHEPYAISVHPQAILRQLWQLEQCWNFNMQRTEGESIAGTVIRIRPDLWFRAFYQPFSLFRDYPEDLAFTPWWGRFGGINDRFAVMGHKAAQAYFTTYSRIPQLLAAGCPLHPESLIKASIEAEGCSIDDHMEADFSKLYGAENPKLAGTFRDPEITAGDIAHMGGRITS